MAEFRKGDKVSWQSHGGTAHGKDVRTITSDTRIGDHTAKPTRDEPQYLVETDDGKQAAHKPRALTKA